MKEKIIEHLKTKKKYNTLENKYEVVCEELERKIFELRVERKLKNRQQETFDNRIEELINENIKLKEENTKLKNNIKKLKKKESD